MAALLLVTTLLCFWVSAVITYENEIVPISQFAGGNHLQSPSPSVSGMGEVRVEHERHSKRIFVLAIAIALALICGLLLFLCCLCLYRLKRLKNSVGHGHQSYDGAKGLSLLPILSKLNSLRIGGKRGIVSLIEYHLLEEATGNFDGSNKIGEGGRGAVYKARLGENFVVAVKKFHHGGTEREFQNEVCWLSKLQHQNIINLLGYSINEDIRLLVYDMMQNGSLQNQLHGPSSGSRLTWSIRMKIALDIARGLEFLHERCEPPVLHKNLKSSSILLDSEFNAKVSGFRQAVSVGIQNKNDVSEASDYLAPEFLLDGKPSDKVDVYAFGVVLLELLTGRKPVEKMSPPHHQSIVTWAMPQLTDRSRLPNIVDPVIKDKMDPKHLYQVAAVGVLCVQPEPSYRPLITDVLHSLIPLIPVELGGSLRAAETLRIIT